MIQILVGDHLKIMLPENSLILSTLEDIVTIFWDTSIVENHNSKMATLL